MSWTKINGIAKHIDCSVRTVRKLIPYGIPHSRLPTGTILFNPDSVDEWLLNHNKQKDCREVVDEIMKEFG